MGLFTRWCLVLFLVSGTFVNTNGTSYRDYDYLQGEESFIQQVSHKLASTEELEGAECRNLEVDKEGIVYVLTDKGVARLFDDKLALDKSFRPLTKRKTLQIAEQNGRLFYLYEDELLSNAYAGKFLATLPPKRNGKFAISTNLNFVRASGNTLTLHEASGNEINSFALPSLVTELYWEDGAFYALAGKALCRISGTNFSSISFDHELTAFQTDGVKIYLGTRNGFYELPKGFSKEGAKLHARLPHTEITAFYRYSNQLWVGTTRGLFLWNPNGPSRYLASKRWLHDDHVVNIKRERNGHLLVLTKTGLTRIEDHPMTLSKKAKYYQKKIRHRHIRFGFCSELYLKTPGDPTSAEMIDTDNDGTWSNYYMASQAFRYGATQNPEARDHAWETFEALERLEEINPLEGFPSRTFERLGFKYSDPDRWHPVGDGKWEWKAHTSSDEIIAHTFGVTAMYQLVAKTEEEKTRLRTFLKKVADHIIRNDWYLVDMDKQPTLWARWNPDYVNWFPPSIVDRKLNSAEIIALLQSVYQMTGDNHYKEKAYELFEKNGYLDNIMIPMSKIALTKGFLHKGHDMGDSWNHSDDLLCFVSYWVLYRTAFNSELREKYAAVIKDHWEIERHEQNPVWSGVYGATHIVGFDYKEAISTLKGFPLDMVAWDIRNSHRKDITLLPESFRGEQMKDFLPADERQITRWNTQSFILDGGSGGRIEFGGDEFLLPYWMMRYNQSLQGMEQNSRLGGTSTK